MPDGGNIYFLTDDERQGLLWSIDLGLRHDDGFPCPRDQSREILRTAQAKLDGSWRDEAYAALIAATNSSSEEQSTVNVEGKIPLAPRGVRQRDFTLGYRACGATMERTFEVLGRATALAEEYGEAIIKIGEALAESTPGGVMRAKTIIAGLDHTSPLNQEDPPC